MLNKQEKEILEKINKRNKKRKIKCVSCDDAHEIGGLTLIQTHHYIDPYGCTGGDYYMEGELQFVCPKTEVVNRLLFLADHDVPWEMREYKNSAGEQFKRDYKFLFKKVVDNYDESVSRKSVNNHYIDEHRGKFGLVKNGI